MFFDMHIICYMFLPSLKIFFLLKISLKFSENIICTVAKDLHGGKNRHSIVFILLENEP